MDLNYKGIKEEQSNLEIQFDLKMAIENDSDFVKKKQQKIIAI